MRDSSGLFVSFQFSGFESFANSHKILAVFFEFTLNEQNFQKNSGCICKWKVVRFQNIRKPRMHSGLEGTKTTVGSNI